MKCVSGVKQRKRLQLVMEDCLHTSSVKLSKLVRWAHSHGTICALIPNLKHLLTEGSHGNLTAMWGCSAGHAYHWPLNVTCKMGPKERGGCYQDSRSINSDSLSLQGGTSACQSSPGGERFLGLSSQAKWGDSSQTRDSCDFSNCSDDNTEADDSNLFDIVCESSATTDEEGDADDEPHHRLRKRGPLGGPGSEDKSVKKIKQETAEEYYTGPKDQLAAGGGTDSGLASHSVSQSPKPNNSQSQLSLSHASPHKPSLKDADCLGGGVSWSPLGCSSPHIPMLAKPLRGFTSSSVSKPSVMSSGSPRHQDPSSGSTQRLRTLPGAAGELMEDLLKPGGSEGPFGDLTPSCLSGMNPDLDLIGAETKGEATVGWALCEMERLRALLSVERSLSHQMGDTISSLKQDKQLLQQELTKKAELICDFLQDQLRPEKRRGHSSIQMEVGLGSSTHMGVGFPDEGMALENSALFESFEEVETHPLDRRREMKRSRDGENTRVRMKNVVGVIARYMAALQEFRRSVSMKVAFDRVGVDRNTISRTAAIAELSLAAPEVFHALPPWDEKEETLAHYAHRCRQAMDDTIHAKIKTMKTKGDLLPIVSKQHQTETEGDFLVSKYPSESQEIYCLLCSQLDSYLASFRAARQKDGWEYEPNSQLPVWSGVSPEGAAIQTFVHCTGFHGSSLTTPTGLEWTCQDFSDVSAETRPAGTDCRIYATPHAPPPPP
ncbi:hypothetical protein J4Q44_G00076980 [Coregonus suidteri]|uniref:Uncharacterized protein n=1 Tax=Coregonus suidteri TaxID=861788 RepID=A0AAN8N9T4_9TELE